MEESVVHDINSKNKCAADSKEDFSSLTVSTFKTFTRNH